eukprot:TRINITY_DN1413_c0_g1_i1.p1 TRINITY_DN1413_c0_g1~~TRINITY_DN1413_c0_g1_i1.p1  ORF type:complete len:120 (+),score=20.43 TRINITY_DN1413_c0_g1_i1:881-1240(+)
MRFSESLWSQEIASRHRLEESFRPFEVFFDAGFFSNASRAHEIDDLRSNLRKGDARVRRNFTSTASFQRVWEHIEKSGGIRSFKDLTNKRSLQVIFSKNGQIKRQSAETSAPCRQPQFP